MRCDQTTRFHLPNPLGSAVFYCAAPTSLREFWLLPDRDYDAAFRRAASSTSFRPAVLQAYLVCTSDHSAPNHRTANAAHSFRGYFIDAGCRVYPPADPEGRWDHRRAVRGSDITSRLPENLRRIEFTCVADWSYSSGCTPPPLAVTQLPSVLQAVTSA